MFFIVGIVSCVHVLVLWVCSKLHVMCLWFSYVHIDGVCKWQCYWCVRPDHSAADSSPPGVSRFEIRSIGQFSEHQSQVIIIPIYTRLFPLLFCCELLSCHVSGFAVAGLSSDHWPLSSLPKMFPCCCEEKFMMHVYRVVCYMVMRCGHWKGTAIASDRDEKD